MPSQDSPDPLQHMSWLRRQARRLIGGGVRSSVDADDLVQSTLREAWTRRESLTFEHDGKLRAWLAKVLRHKAVRVSRNQRRTDRSSQLVSDAPARTSTPSSIVASREQPDDLRARMRMLDERSRQVLQLRFVEQLTFALIGERLSMSEANARKVFGRSVAELRAATNSSAPTDRPS